MKKGVLLASPLLCLMSFFMSCGEKVDWCAGKNRLMRIWQLERIDYIYPAQTRVVTDTLWFEEYTPEGKYTISFCMQKGTPLTVFREGTWQINEANTKLVFDGGTYMEESADILELTCDAMTYKQESASPYTGKHILTRRLKMILDCPTCPEQ